MILSTLIALLAPAPPWRERCHTAKVGVASRAAARRIVIERQWDMHEVIVSCDVFTSCMGTSVDYAGALEIARGLVAGSTKDGLTVLTVNPGWEWLICDDGRGRWMSIKIVKASEWCR
jgi:N-acetylglucosamine kinase-like BadF-type ATPase